MEKNVFCVAAGQDSLTQLMTALSDSQARIEQLQERRSAIISDRHNGEQRLAELAERLQSLTAQGKQLAQKEQSLLETQRGVQERHSKLEEELSALRTEIAESEGNLIKRRAEKDRLVARHMLLTRLRQELTGYFPGVRKVLDTTNKLTGILGTVASLMDVPRELEQAIESALGSRLQNVVVKRWEDAEKAINK